MSADPDRPLLRIGELSRRVGVSDHLLRAWESRYGLLQPERSPGGFRLYSEADEWRVRRMQAYRADGLSAAEAARAALSATGAAPAALPSTGTPAAQAPPAGTPAPSAGTEPAALAGQLQRALDAFDEPAAQAVLDRLLAELSVPAVLRDVMLPYLQDLGDRWQRGTATVAMEHFASNVIRGRLAGLARGWGSGRGPLALLACAPGEQHDLALMMFGIVLHGNGWRIDYLGANTPVTELARAAELARPDLTVLSATEPAALVPLQTDLAALARHGPLALAGPAVSAQIAAEVGARLMTADPVSEAERAAWP
jgi:MerR family transcriptional regulator, light-induced transcriptional regulator